MKKLLIGLTFFTSVLSFSAEKVDQLAFEMTGFKITLENNTELKLEHVSGLKLVMSKKSFSSEEAASRFCKIHGSKLDTDFNVLVLAMSGAALQNEIILDLITFDIKVETGIMSWSGKGNNKVQMMYDGKGGDGDEISIDVINKRLKKITNDQSINFKVPAICKEND